MTDTQFTRLSSIDEDEVAQLTSEIFSDDDDDAQTIKSYSGDESEDELTPPVKVPRRKRRHKSDKPVGNQEPVTPERPKPEHNTSPIVFKAHKNDLAYAGRDPINMLQKTAYDSLALELEGAIHTETNLVSNAIPQCFDLDDILQQLSLTKRAKSNVALAKGVLRKYSDASKKWINWPATNKKNTEKELGEYLNEFADDVRTLLDMEKSENDLVFSYQFRNSGPPTGYTTQRKPDLVVVPRSNIESKDLRWTDFRSVVSLKIASQSQKDERVQLSEYARLCFAEQYDRRYFIAFGLRHTKLTFYVFDRSGVLQSQEYDVHEKPLVFLRVAINILFLENAQLGYDPAFSVSVNGRKCLSMQNKCYIIMRKIFTDRSICGRGTVCLKVRRRKGEVKVRVIKDSWVDRSRPVKEFQMLLLLKKYKIKNVPELIAHEIVRIRDESGQMVMDSTERFRGSNPGVDIRDHHRLVMYPYGQSLKSFSSLPELLSAIRDVLQTIKDLNERGILHRDISIGNIVLVKDCPGYREGYRKGYLIDFDFAIQNTDNRVISRGKRSGTLPFMACDVLAKTGEYTALLDAESTLYVLIWLAFTQAGPNGTERLVDESFKWKETILGVWNPAGIVDEARLICISGSKRGIMGIEKDFKIHILEKMHPYFKPTERCLVLLRKILFDPEWNQPSASKKLPENFDDFVLDDTTTQFVKPDPDSVLDKMVKAVNSCLKILDPGSNNAEGASTSGKLTEVADLPGLAMDVMPATEDAQSQPLEDSQSQSSEDVNSQSSEGSQSHLSEDGSDVDSESIRSGSAPSMNGEDNRPQTLNEKIGRLKLRDHLKKESDPQDSPANPESLYKKALRSKTQRLKTAEDPEAQSLAPALELAHSQHTRFADSYLPARSPAQSLGKRSREETNMVLPNIPTATFYGEPESSKRTKGPPSRKLRKGN